MSRRLPTPRNDGPEVSELTFRVVELALKTPSPRVTGGGSSVTMLEVVDFLALELDVDEADVLRSLAELERVGWIA